MLSDALRRWSVEEEAEGAEGRMAFMEAERALSERTGQG